MENNYILEMENITKIFPRVVALENVRLKVKKGTVILGFAGLKGAGRTEVMQCIFGIAKSDQGEKIEIKSPQEDIKHKIALLTEDRKRAGLFPLL
ncbi:ABC transporter [Anaerovirgula multivorans]|uniref:ABC transporter n=1 Tax=Anaerovirgula multivorans TaxID=312168 RepID=A0A239AQK1_9FIRM|nr:ATP-binding cassette domain-containing protein [Anaerovirgula multivorans]SNR97631.1 ABC transporter [Anaerovirgula multivorans]